MTILTLGVAQELTKLQEEAHWQMKYNQWGDEKFFYNRVSYCRKCTFEKGYISQPVYACKDCMEETGEVVQDFGFF